MRQDRSLSHSRWECKYHVVFIPKYRKKSDIRADSQGTGRCAENAWPAEGSWIEEGHLIQITCT